MVTSTAEALAILRLVANSRIALMRGQDALYQIEVEKTGPVSRGGVVTTGTWWEPVISNLSKSAAETLIPLAKT